MAFFIVVLSLNIHTKKNYTLRKELRIAVKKIDNFFPRTFDLGCEG